MFKCKKEICLLMAICLILVIPKTAAASPMDLDHGSGCMHNHISSCYHTHSYGCYNHHRHNSSCYMEHDAFGGATWTDHEYCSTCGYSTNVSKYWRACTRCAWREERCVCDNCNTTLWNDTDSSKCLICTTPAETLTCSKSSSTLECTKGTYGNCVLPTVFYNIPTGWTNQDVTINYSGTETGSLVFTENGTKELVITSPSGHRIKDVIAVVGIDKMIPEVPEYELQEGSK